MLNGINVWCASSEIVVVDVCLLLVLLLLLFRETFHLIVWHFHLTVDWGWYVCSFIQFCFFYLTFKPIYYFNPYILENNALCLIPWKSTANPYYGTFEIILPLNVRRRSLKNQFSLTWQSQSIDFRFVQNHFYNNNKKLHKPEK